ncbi:MAG: hypothetical protein ACYC6N_03625 [Pirellulaceae bacterium]
MRSLTVMSIVVLCTAGALGCARSGDHAAGQSAASVSRPYLLASQPSGAKGVAEVRQSAKEGDEVVVTGRVGGDAEPFIDGAAAFTIVDPLLQPCPPDEGCPTPWDYCCDADKTAANKALVKVVDAQGRIVATDARELLNVEPLSQVVVRGRAKRDGAGNLTVLADGVYVSR